LPSRSLPPLECGFGVKPSVTPKACFQHDAARSRAVLKPEASGKVAARTLEVIGPIPGILFRRRATASVSEVRLISAVTSSIFTLVSRNCSASSRTELSALAGRPHVHRRSSCRIAPSGRQDQQAFGNDRPSRASHHGGRPTDGGRSPYPTGLTIGQVDCHRSSSSGLRLFNENLVQHGRDQGFLVLCRAGANGAGFARLRQHAVLKHLYMHFQRI